uniref:Protein kinase domain-containing protein n=1 Tax=Acrobeloides nanus TaxID=290746 RepID=A0A914CLN6_9BILA
MISDNLLAFTILFEALAQTSDIYYGYLMCSTRSDTSEHDREKESENEHELEDWAEWQDEFLDKPPYLKNFLESSHDDDDQHLVPYNKNLKNGSYSYSRQEAPDLSLALASAIEFITSKLTGTNAYLVKETLYKSLTSAGLLRSEYLSDAFAASRASFILVLSNLISNIDRGTKYSLNFSPNVDSPLSVPSGNFTLGPSRYHQDFDEIECIGNGGFGEVFKARSKIDEQFYAIKKIRLRKVRCPNAFHKMINECRLHASLVAYPHLLRYHNAWIECESFNSESLPSTSQKVHSAIELSEEIKIRTDGVASTIESMSESTNAENRFWRKPTQNDHTSSPFVTFNEDASDEAQSIKEKTINNLCATQESSSVNGVALIKQNSIVSLPEPNYLRFPPVLHIQMELCETTLEKYTNERNAHRKPIDEEFNKKVVRSLLSAMVFLHKNKIIHRDIKPSNIFLKKHKDGFHVLLGDFGLAKDQSAKVYGLEQEQEANFSEPLKKLSLGIGTYSYASPEQLNSRNYDSKTDIYSCGVVVYELYNIFHTSMERSNSLKTLRATARTPVEFLGERPVLASMIDSMIRTDSYERPSAEKLLKLFERKISRRAQLVEDVQNLRRENKELKSKNASLEEQIESWKKKYEALEAIVRLQSGT